MVSSNKLDKLEAIRGLAALYVVLHHSFSSGFTFFGKDFSLLFKLGQEAVILFFLLSGFVINYSFVKAAVKSIKTFIIKRVGRIYIPLLIVFALNFITAYLNDYNFAIRDLWIFLGNIFMLQDISSLKLNVICPPFLGNTPLWSLSYEWWFYIIFILTFHYIKFKNSFSVYIVGTICTISYIFYPMFLNREFMYLIIWWVGVDLAAVYREHGKILIQNIKVPIFFLGINIILLTINVIINYNGSKQIGVSPFLELRHFTFSLFAVGFALLWQNYKWVAFNIMIGPFKYLAPVSFVLYISHWFLVTKAQYLDGYLKNNYLKFGIYLIICIGISYLIERVLYPKINKFIFRPLIEKSRR